MREEEIQIILKAIQEAERDNLSTTHNKFEILSTLKEDDNNNESD